MQPESVAILPPHSYAGHSRQSSAAIAWLELEQLKLPTDELIRTAIQGGLLLLHEESTFGKYFSTGEVKYGKYYVDGYLKKSDGRAIVYEFLG